MREPTFAPAYLAIYPALAEVANTHGYALAVHGSVQRDFDLVAVPWTEQATDAESLVRALWDRVSYLAPEEFTHERLMKPPFTEQKPHGRRSWAIPLYCGAVLDVSVMPICTTPPSPAGDGDGE